MTIPGLLSSRRASVASVVVACARSAMGTAAVHSRNETTVPAHGATLRNAPELMVMTFNRPRRVTMLDRTDSDGDAVPPTRCDGMAPVTRLEATPEPLSAGSHAVRWRALAGGGRPTSCRFAFEVQR